MQFVTVNYLPVKYLILQNTIFLFSVKMSYTIGPAQKLDAEKKEVHSIPCSVQYTGPAEVSSNFIREQIDGESAERGMFRGRGMEGAEWKAPEGYEIHVLKERKGLSQYIFFPFHK